MTKRVRDVVIELPKSRLPAGAAVEGGEYPFFISGPLPLRIDQAINYDPAVILSTGGNAAVHYCEERYSYSTDSWALRPIESEVNGKFLFYFLLSQIENIAALGFEGSGLKHLRKDYVRDFKVPFFEKTEQSKIAGILSTVDRAIEETEALIAKQQRIKTGLMQDLLTRGIDENGNIRSESTHKFKDSPLGRIPVEWDVVPLGAVSLFVTSGARGWAKYYREDGAIFVRIGNLTREHINLRMDDVVYVRPPELAEGLRTKVQAGDLLISVTADLGIIGVIPKDFGAAYVNQHVSLVRLHTKAVNPRFIGWFLSSYLGQTQFDRLNESGAKAGLNLPTVRSLLSVKPSMDEQDRIASTMDQCVGARDHNLHVLKKLRQFRLGLMQDLLTGKRRVTALLDQKEGEIA